MEKQHLKRLSYGFSALVLGLSAVNFLPVAGVYAEPVNEEPVINAPAADPEVPAADPEAPAADPEAPAADPEAPAELEAPAEPGVNQLALAEGDDDGAVARVNTNYDFISKTVNINDSFTVKAVKNGQVTAYDVTSGGLYLASVEDGEEDDDEPAGPPIATDEQITINESAPGEYDIMPLKAGRYAIGIQGYEMVEGILTHRFTEVMVMAVGATTEAATTITDVINGYSEANEIAEKAWQEYMEVASNPDSTDAEIEAAYKAFQEKDEKAFSSARQKEENAFGDDADAIWEAVETGKTIATAVAVTELDEADVDADVKNALLEKLDVTFVSNVKYYDVDINVYANGEFIGTLKELTGKQAVVITGYEAAPAGYKRVYKVLGYHTRVDENGATYTEVVEINDVEFDEETGAIIYEADKFSTYLVAYKDVFAPSVNTGVATDIEGASATSSAALSVVAIATMLTLAGAIKFAKARK